MTDQHDAAARAIVEERICCTAAQHCQVEALAIRIATALRAAYEAGQRDMREAAALEVEGQSTAVNHMPDRLTKLQLAHWLVDRDFSCGARLRALPLKGGDHG